MSMTDNEQSFFNIVRFNYPKNCDKIIEAYEFAKSAHEGIVRKSGEPYVVHPLEVAKILIKNNMDYATIVAGLLHDVVEDTSFTLDDIKEKFGETVAKLVHGVTKIDNLTLEKEKLTEADSMKRLLIAMGDDVRVIFIKLADRLHNMRTIEFLSREKQLKMATETNELFIPIAERIGIRKIRSELQELVFKCIKPEEYIKIKTGFDKKLEEEKLKIGGIERQLSEYLGENGLDCAVVGWPERYYSIYKKMQTKGMGKVFGLILIKVIVPTEIDCYKALGFLHSKFDHIPSQIKDFISAPKPNGYKSLHTILVSKTGDLMFKVMIRTHAMDNVCEYGISCLWNNKDAEIDYFEKFERFNTFKKIVLSEKDEVNNTDAFIDAIKTDLSSKTTWVFTSTYRPICLRTGNPTAIDFAYALDTRVGHNAISAVVNGKKASIGAELSTGDVVEIILSKTDKSPSRNWIFATKTPEARRKIREYFYKNTTKKNIELGKAEIVEELDKMGHTLDEFLSNFSELKKEFDFSNVNDMYASLGYKSVTKNQLLKHVFIKKEQKKLIDNCPVEIEGATGFLNINFPKCCSAIPGDEIVGVMSRNGVAIHTADCNNLSKITNIIKLEAKWKENIEQVFNVNLKVVAKNKTGFASRLFNLIALENIDISKIEAKNTNAMECEFKLNIYIKDNLELDRICNKIMLIEEVKCVSRVAE